MTEMKNYYLEQVQWYTKEIAWVQGRLDWITKQFKAFKEVDGYVPSEDEEYLLKLRKDYYNDLRRYRRKQQKYLRLFHNCKG